MFTPGSRACGYKTASGLGKWLSRDPIEEEGGLHLYALVGNDALNWTDGLGLAKRCPDLNEIIGRYGIKSVVPSDPGPLAVEGMAWQRACDADEIARARQQPMCRGKALECTVCFEKVKKVRKTRRLTGVFPPKYTLKISTETEEGMAFSCCSAATTLYVDPFLYPFSAIHISLAQSMGQPRVLTIDRDHADENRDDSLRGIPPYGGGFDRDEYPPAMFREGGNEASVFPNPFGDNRGSGSTLGHLLAPFPNGTQVEIRIRNGP
jgi:hypothetical protein